MKLCWKQWIILIYGLNIIPVKNVFTYQISTLYIILSIRNNSDPQHLPYSPLFSWMKSAKLKSSKTHMVQWLTAVVRLILKEISASCHLKLTSQTSFSHTRDQLLMWYARSTRTTGCHSWDSKKNGHFVLFMHLGVQKRDLQAIQSAWTCKISEFTRVQPHICICKSVAQLLNSQSSDRIFSLHASTGFSIQKWVLRDHIL